VIYAALFESPAWSPVGTSRTRCRPTLDDAQPDGPPDRRRPKGLRHVSVAAGHQGLRAPTSMPIQVPARAKPATRTSMRTSTGCRRTTSAGRRTGRTGPSHLAAADRCSWRDRRGHEPDPDPGRLRRHSAVSSACRSSVRARPATSPSGRHRPDRQGVGLGVRQSRRRE